MNLGIERIALNCLDTAGEDHALATLVFGGAEDVVGRFDIVVE
jgi:hypothetical protein